MVKILKLLFDYLLFCVLIIFISIGIANAPYVLIINKCETRWVSVLEGNPEETDFYYVRTINYGKQNFFSVVYDDNTGWRNPYKNYIITHWLNNCWNK
jgi:NAD(P)H-flavin reductase